MIRRAALVVIPFTLLGLFVLFVDRPWQTPPAGEDDVDVHQTHTPATRPV